MRTTRKQVESLFAILCKAAGRRVAKDYKDIGAWSLDYSSYGGYVIVELMDRGAQAQPFGPKRRRAGQMWDAMQFALRCLENAKPVTKGRYRK